MTEVKTIETLLTLSFDVLYLADMHKAEQYWIVYEFNEPVKTGVESIDYGVVRGIEITDFLAVNHIQLKNQIKHFQESLNKYIDESMVTRLKFSDNHTWKLYGK